MKNFLLSAIVIVLTMVACTKVEEDNRPNPFAGQKPDDKQQDSLNPSTIQGLHKYIFATRCANPTCHDGTFEPDFRTVTSTYNTLVFHPVTKNDSKGSFQFRVVAGDHKKSWLHERLITGDGILGRMPLYATPLNENEMRWVRAWIDSGARDMNGVPAREPNSPPQVTYRLAFDDKGKRLDTILYGSSRFIMKLPPNTNVTLAVVLADDKTPIKELDPNYFRFSFQRYNFNGAISKAAYFLMQTWVVTFNTSEFPKERQIFFRFYTNDGALPSEVEFPTNTSDRFTTDLYSFYVAD